MSLPPNDSQQPVRVLKHSRLNRERLVTRSDDGYVEHLQRLPKLKELALFKTQVTPAGLARFRAAKPNCQIRTDVK